MLNFARTNINIIKALLMTHSHLLSLKETIVLSSVVRLWTYSIFYKKNLPRGRGWVKTRQLSDSKSKSLMSNYWVNICAAYIAIACHLYEFVVTFCLFKSDILISKKWIVWKWTWTWAIRCDTIFGFKKQNIWGLHITEVASCFSPGSNTGAKIFLLLI